jgi:hypothetical protein
VCPRQIRIFGRLQSLRNIVSAVAAALPHVCNALLVLFTVVII